MSLGYFYFNSCITIILILWITCLKFNRIAFIFTLNCTLIQSHHFVIIPHFYILIRRHYISQQCVAAHKYWNELSWCTIVQKSQCSLIYDSLYFFVHMKGVYTQGIWGYRFHYPSKLDDYTLIILLFHSKFYFELIRKYDIVWIA